MKVPDYVILACALLVLALVIGFWIVRDRAPVPSYVLPLREIENPDVTPTPEGGKIDLNAADYKALLTIPGIGEVLAGRIIHYRSEIVAFRSLDQLMDIYGIGEETYLRISPYLTIQ